jgi:hypothetical protein
MNKGHHLLLGELKDVITDATVADTHDERFRQKIARLLIGPKEFSRDDIVRQFPLEINVDGRCAKVPVTYSVHIDGRIAMLVQYGPGSLVTRYRPALAMGRLVAPYQVPVVVVTNGEQADVLDGITGKVLWTGLEHIPDRQSLGKIAAAYSWQPLPSRQAAMEARIVMAFEVDDRCPCDDTVCTFPVT